MKKILVMAIAMFAMVCNAQPRTVSASTDYVDARDKALVVRLDSLAGASKANDVKILALSNQLTTSQNQVASLITAMQTLQNQSTSFQTQLNTKVDQAAYNARMDTSFRKLVSKGNVYLTRGLQADTIDCPIK